MKTKLLLLAALLISAFGNSQVQFSQDFETIAGLTGWTYPSGTTGGQGYSKSSSVPCGGSFSAVATHNAAANNFSHGIHSPNYTSTGVDTNFSFDYRLIRTNPDFGIGANVSVGFVVNNGNFTSISDFYTSATACTNWTGIIPTGILPVGSNVKIVVSSTRNNGFFIIGLDNFIATLGNAPVLQIPSISAISSTVSSTNAVITYTLNANNAPTTSLIRYSTDSNNLSTQVVGFNAAGNVNTTNNRVISNLVGATQYFYEIQATNSQGTFTSPIGTFTTSPIGAPIAEYTFDNTMNSISGNMPFDTNAGTSFVADRNGNASSALNLNIRGTSATITGIPVNNQSRTISLWIKPNVVLSDNILFTYGSAAGDSVYGASYTPTNIFNFTYNSNVGFVTTNTVNIWKHIVYTYEQATGLASIYVNGVLANSAIRANWSTANLQNFYLGRSFNSLTGAMNASVDDLKIYNRALSQADITSLFTNNTLSSQNFNQNNLEVSLYPNPTNDVLNIDMTNEVKSVEIYNIQGQKVLSSNQKQINVSRLASGIYLVKVTDSLDAVATKRIIVDSKQ